MKAGLIISGLIVVMFALALLLTTASVPDKPTSATNKAALALQALPATLPAMYKPTDSGDTCNPHYRRAVDVFARNAKALLGDKPPKDEIEAIVGHLLAGMAAAKVNQPLFDDQFPMRLIDEPPYGNALHGTALCALNHADQLAMDKKKTEALEIAKAAFAFSHRLFTHCRILQNRRSGLVMLDGELIRMIEWSGKDAGFQKAAREYQPVLQDINAAWVAKMSIVAKPEPNIGDLLNVQANDEDVSFRIEATRWLGVVRHRPRSKGNLNAILGAIAEGKNSADSDIRRAAEMADTFSDDDRMKMR